MRGNNAALHFTRLNIDSDKTLTVHRCDKKSVSGRRLSASKTDLREAHPEARPQLLSRYRCGRVEGKLTPLFTVTVHSSGVPSTCRTHT